MSELSLKQVRNFKARELYRIDREIVVDSRECGICGKRFPITLAQKKICSSVSTCGKDCARRLAAKRLRSRELFIHRGVCTVCGKDFLIKSHRVNAKTCGEICRAKQVSLTKQAKMKHREVIVRKGSHYRLMRNSDKLAFRVYRVGRNKVLCTIYPTMKDGQIDGWTCVTVNDAWFHSPTFKGIVNIMVANFEYYMRRRKSVVGLW